LGFLKLVSGVPPKIIQSLDHDDWGSPICWGVATTTLQKMETWKLKGTLSNCMYIYYTYQANILEKLLGIFLGTPYIFNRERHLWLD
jgi:hypothetical protein